MKNKFYLLIISFVITLSNAAAHDIYSDHVALRKWHLVNGNKEITGNFFMMKEDQVLLQGEDHSIQSYPLKSFSAEDITYIQHRQDHIEELNHAGSNPVAVHHTQWNNMLLVVFLCIVFFITGWLASKKSLNERFKAALPVLLIAICFLFFNLTRKLFFSPDPIGIAAAFEPFIPEVHTFWDSTYFWVESKGIPTTHPMMAGISSTGWQRQVPIPQCYTGANAWPFPLNPVKAANPIPVDSVHFTRGAIAIAVNGVPIFNQHTNTGADAFASGQLDQYGGHSGRADDYHYHIAPLHLYAYTRTSLPVAYGLDGYPVFGSTEPDGTPMKALDANHGHTYGASYHYHGTTAYPYMIGKMAGQVTEDNTHQLIPQAAAHPVRVGQNPLRGALITACNPNGKGNGYTLIYTYQNKTDSVVYSWDVKGNYTFKYYTEGRLDSMETNRGFVQCNVPVTTGTKSISQDQSISIYEGPSNKMITVVSNIDISRITIMDISGIEIRTQIVNDVAPLRYCVELGALPSGIYLMKIQTCAGAITRKFVLP